jgi:hypothetical protein
MYPWNVPWKAMGVSVPQTFFHNTTEEAAAFILRDGSRDATGTYLTSQEWTGVWVSDVPLDSNEGAKGNVLLCVSLVLPDAVLSDFEWIEEGKPYREWLIPAALLNKHGKVTRCA